MAFENFDKQAVAEMAKAYDKSQQTKVGFWGGLLSFLGCFGSNESTSSIKSIERYSVENNSWYGHYAGNDSEMTVPFAKHSNYSPMTGDD